MRICTIEAWLDLQVKLESLGLLNNKSFLSEKTKGGFKWQPHKNLMICLDLECDSELDETVLHLTVNSSRGWNMVFSSDNKSIFACALALTGSYYLEFDHPWIGRDIYEVLTHCVSCVDGRIDSPNWEVVGIQDTLS